MGRSSQRKGAGGEIELAAIFSDTYGYKLERGGSLSYGTKPDLSGLRDIHMEVKRVERLNLTEAMAQAVKDSERFKDGAPTVFHRRNRRPWLVTMRLSDWVKLYRESGR